MKKHIYRTKVLEVVKTAKYFECEFIKKDKSYREMRCIFKSSKIDSEYIIVFDVDANGFRNVNLSTLIDITIMGETYEIK